MDNLMMKAAMRFDKVERVATASCYHEIIKENSSMTENQCFVGIRWMAPSSWLDVVSEPSVGIVFTI